MDRQNRQLTALSLILLVVVTFVIFDWDRAERDKPSSGDGPRTHDVFDYQSDEIVRVKLVRPAETIVFERKDGTWIMTSPLPALADASRVDAIVQRFETLRVEDRALEGAKADYGLDEAARVEVRFEYTDGTAFTAYVGLDSTVGYATFGMLPGDAAPHVFDGQVGKLVGAPVDDFRGRNLLTFSPSSAHRIRIVDGGAETVLRKDEAGWWVGDSGPRADDEKVGSYLSALTLIKVAHFLDGKTAAGLGLDAAPASVSVEDEGGAHTVKIGLADADGADVATGDVPVRVSTADRATLLSAETWPSDRLFQSQSWKVDSLTVTFGGQNLSATRKDGSWTRADGTAIDNASDIVEALLNLSVVRTSPATMTGTHGRVRLGMGTGTSTILVGDPVEGGRVAKDEGGGPAFVIPDSTLLILAEAAAGRAAPKAEPTGDPSGGLPPGMDIDALLKGMGGPQE